MMLKEFEKLTGIYPDHYLYAQIEKLYMDSGEDKTVFCKNYVANKDGIAEKAQMNANQLFSEVKDRYEEIIDDLEAKLAAAEKQQSEANKQIESLKADREKLLVWETKETCSKLTKEKYQELLHASKGDELLSDEEARDTIAEEFGFSPEKIEILHSVRVIEINQLGETRRVEEERQPVYNASDWNYIRFNVKGNMTFYYEMIDCELEKVYM